MPPKLTASQITSEIIALVLLTSALIVVGACAEAGWPVMLAETSAQIQPHPPPLHELQSLACRTEMLEGIMLSLLAAPAVIRTTWLRLGGSWRRAIHRTAVEQIVAVTVATAILANGYKAAIQPQITALLNGNCGIILQIPMPSGAPPLPTATKIGKYKRPRPIDGRSDQAALLN